MRGPNTLVLQRLLLPPRQDTTRTDKGPCPDRTWRPTPTETDDEDTEIREDGDEESFANLLLLRHFPEMLYVAPAHGSSRRSIRALLSQGSPASSNDHIPNAWTVHENMLYSLVDPERSRLKNVIDAGAMEQLDAREWAFSSDANWRRCSFSL